MTLEIQNVSKRLGKNVVLQDISLRVEPGEFFVLLGTSGSGKSTLLRLIAGLDKPDTGRILLDGRDVTDLPSRERNLGMVFQDYGLYPNMDVYHNVAYGLETRGVPRAEVDTRVREATKKLQIDHYLKKGIGELSGGEQQRVALARALAKDSAAYLYDEPLSNLDPKLRYSARRDIQEVHRLKRKPSLYVTHDQTEAFALADRIGIMSAGVLQQVGTPETLTQAPVNTFVLGFLGTVPVNLVEGDVVRAGDGYQFCVENLELTLPPRFNALLEAYPHPRILAGIRPEALTLASAAQRGTTVTGTIDVVEELLGETVVIINVNGRTSLTALLTDFDPLGYDTGTPLTLAVDTDALLLFDVESQRSLEA